MNLEKIELEPKKISEINDVQMGSMEAMKVKRRRKTNLKKPAVIVLGVLVVFIILSLFLIVFPAQRTYKSAKKTYAQAKVFEDALKQQNIALASDELVKTKTDLTDTQKELNSLFILRFIPIANWYYNDASHMVKAGQSGLDTAKIVVDAIKPYADILGLKGAGSFTMGSAEDRIKTAVMTMSKITPKIDEISGSLSSVKSEVDNINPNHYPEFLFGKKVKTQLQQVRDLTDQGVSFVAEARPLIKVLPSLLGEKEAKRYLLIFQNDKELRATGGFITAYAIFNVDKGVIKVEKSADIYDLDASVPNKPVAPDPILKYLPKVPVWNLRDTNLSPDFVESMKTFKKMYDTAGQSVNVDGIIALDTNVLVSTIKILDDSISAGGLTFTTQNDPRCDCPQVIYELEDNISRPVGYIKQDRKGLLGDLLFAIMKKALSSSPKVYWGPLFQSMLMQTNQKHVLFYLYDQDAQSGVEALNAAGKILPFDGDYLHINDVNFAGAKSNLFVTEAVENIYDIGKDGTVTKTVNITYKNTHPPSDCNLERGQLCLNAELRNWLRIYVPKGSEMTDSKGSQVKMTSYEELGKTVFEGFLRVRPEGSANFSITYRLPFKLKSGSDLPVLIQKQPGTFGNDYSIEVNGRKIETFQLFTDKQFKINR